MSAKKQSSILGFFSRKPPSTSAEKKPIETEKKSNGTEKRANGAQKEESILEKSIDKTKEEEEMDELAKLCVEDDEDDKMVVVEPKMEIKKRKRITLMADSSDEELDDDVQDKTYTPNKKQKLAEFNQQPFSFSTPKSVTKAKKSSFSTPEVTKNKKDKENTSPPSSAKKLKDKLSAFASPSLNASKNNDSIDSTNDEEPIDASAFSHISYPFLQASAIRDKNGRKPDHPDYDSTTLYIPESFLSQQTPAQRQWWDLKMNHYDKVLFFKMGKFYELFHMDAVLAVERCGLIYMKSKAYAHCGFPEAGYERYSEVLVNLGYRVVRIEQTETPADMEARVQKMHRPTKFDKVVRREICQVESIGTSGEKDSYLTAFTASKSIDNELGIEVGLCYVDTSLGQINLCQFSDDYDLSALETLLAFFPPSEIILDKSKSPLLQNLVNKFSYVPKRVTNFPLPTKTLKKLHDYYGDKSEWPTDLHGHLDESDSLGLTPLSRSNPVLAAFGAVINFLNEALVDNQIMEQKQVRNILPPLDKRNVDSNAGDNVIIGSKMILDNKTLQHLDILPNPETPEITSLFNVIDKTSTHMGKRLLRQWVCMPLLRREEIEDRQEFVKYFCDHVEVVHCLQESLKGIPDLEKLASTIYALGVKLPSDHPEQVCIFVKRACQSN